MGKQSVKQQRAVPLLHDGPLSQDPENFHGTMLLVEAAFALRFDDAVPSISVRLLADLAQTKRITDQLVTLQNFKGVVIQKNRRKKPVSDENNNVESAIARGLEDTDFAELEKVYRILLGWSLGYLSPAPLRRTIYSVLETLYDIHPTKDSLEYIFLSTMESIIATDPTWKSPLYSLEALLVLAQYRPVPYLEAMVDPSLTYLCKVARSLLSELTPTGDLIGEGVGVVKIVKTILQDARVSTILDLYDIRVLCWKLLLHPHTPIDSLPILGMVYGRSVPYDAKKNRLHTITGLIDSAVHDLSPLSRVYVVQGLAAGVPDDIWMTTLRLFLAQFTHTAQNSIDPEVRLAALKGSRTLVSRSMALLENDASPSELVARIAVMADVSDVLLEVVLQAWENPPTKKMGNSLPPTFQAVVDWKELLEEKSFPGPSQDGSVLKSLVDRLLQQPPYRKGKYKALELILAKVGVRNILLPGESSHSSSALLSDLLNGIGDSGHNTGVMADLWTKLLRSLFMEFHETTYTPSRKPTGMQKETDAVPNRLTVSDEWLKAWVPSLANALLSVELKRRKRVASFCLPKVFVMGLDRVDTAVQSFAALLDQIVGFPALCDDEIPSKDRETSADRVLWATMEIIRYSTVEKKLISLDRQASADLTNSIAKNMPLHRLREGLIHFSSVIRTTSFQAMEGVVQSHLDGHMACCLCEMKLWCSTLTYAIKEETKEYLSIILFRLLSFLDRLSRLEATELARSASSNPSLTLPHLYKFIDQHLICDILIKHSTYPASVVAKETFGLALLECLIIYTCRDLKLALESNMLPKTGALFLRTRSAVEERTLSEVRAKLVSSNVVSSLFSSLHSSTWEGTKAKSFQLLATLILLARQQGLPLPLEIFGPAAEALHTERAQRLASSPRQREADTGARILALLGLSKSQFSSRMQYVEDLTTILQGRLEDMKTTLGLVLKPDTDVVFGKHVPLVHGIILALRLIVQSDSFDIPKDGSLEPLSRLASTLCDGMRISLAVVADVRDGEDLEGLDGPLGTTASAGASKVNPGAIGANGIFSSLSRIDAMENERRLASQRIVVGSWLLMREACAAVAAVMTLGEFCPSEDLSNLSGTLLISTLTSLKHTGAAFAAHSALQEITKTCLKRKHLKSLPGQWTDRLFHEILSADKIRDSTLRRSTGYALGFLSVMRSEVSLRSSPCSICAGISQEILLATLPSPSRLQDFLETVQLDSQTPSRVFSFLDYSVTDEIDQTPSVRSRVHALNVLRTMILDAPLAKIMSPLVGDAIVASTIGYVDSEWSIRNSAGMVFSAAMLRVVDADKNATNAETTSKNAITLSELFQSYPTLCEFLLAVLAACVNGELTVDGGGSLPPILPILVLLYRVQPLESGDPIVAEKMQRFDSALHACLHFHHLRVRQAAAKALCNLSGGDISNPLSVARIYQRCISILRSPEGWNQLHGAILLLKEMSVRQKLSPDTFDMASDFDALLGLLRVSATGLAAPPLCVADAIRVLDLVDQSTAAQQSSLDLCSRLISWASQDTKVKMEVPGMYELCTTAAQTVARLLTCRIFGNAKQQKDERILALHDLSKLFHSDVLEVRVATVKTFKKAIYRGLDSLVLQPYPGTLEMLTVLSNSLSEAIQNELSRDAAVATSNVNTHPPSIRRLSRCLLEVLNTIHSFKQQGSPVLKICPWDLGMAMLDWKGVDSGEPTPLVGNAIELLANAFGKEYPERFWHLLQHLASSSVPWRLRYSAACTVSRLWQTCVDLRPQLHPFVCQLLQDEDPDCRYEMVKALRPDHSSTLPVSEYVLTTFVRNNRELNPGDADIFWETLLDTAHQAAATLSRLVEERESDSERKIFEIEDPNSYHEPAWFYQASLVVYWNVVQSSDTTASMRSSTLLATHDRLTTAVVDILTLLTTRQDDADHLSALVFSTLHTVLLAAAASSSFQGATTRLTQAVQTFWSSFGKRSHLLWHPVWTWLFQALAADRPTDTTTATPLSWEQVQQFCFLLPSSSSPVETDDS